MTPPAGTAAALLATLEAARDRIRELRQAAFRLGEADSGTAEAPILYRGATPREGGAGEPARLSSGRLITGFAPVTDEAALERLPEIAREHVVQVDLADHGISNPGLLERRGFTQHGRPALSPSALEG